MTLMREVEPTLQAYLNVMREKLAENEHKGHWRDEDVDFLLDRVAEELRELRLAVWLGEGPRAVAREAADVGAIAMMVADVLGGLDEYRAS